MSKKQDKIIAEGYQKLIDALESRNKPERDEDVMENVICLIFFLGLILIAYILFSALKSKF